MDTINSVRQVLMNELGLTRESVREEMKDIIDSVVEKQVNRLIDEGILERMVERYIKNMYGPTMNESIKLAVSSVSKSLFDAAKEKVNNSIQIIIKESE
jgi:polyhydroxyalkanoate synthesis regulator phasin